jgi:hypothetical protein
MKMFFSANKIGLPPQISSTNLSQIQEKKQPIENQLSKQDLFQANVYSLKYGMFIRIQSASGCSNCGK